MSLPAGSDRLRAQVGMRANDVKTLYGAAVYVDYRFNGQLAFVLYLWLFYTFVLLLFHLIT